MGEIVLKTSRGRVLSIIAGAMIFAALLFAVHASLPSALIGGVIGWLAVTLISNKKEENDTIVVEGLTKQELENTIKAGRKLTSGMRQATQRLSQTEIRHEIEDLCRIADSMFDMLKTDPKDIRIVKRFISHYLEPTHKIILKYADLATVRPMPADAIATLERTEKSLKDIRATFLQQKEKMLSNDVIDLDTEIKVFETVSKNMETDPKKTDRNSSSQF